MRRILYAGLLLYSCFLLAAPSVSAADLADSVVKIFATTNPMDFYRPWQSKGLNNISGSGVIISDHEILTNAHVVANHTFIQVKRHGDPQKYTARVKAIGYDCDLALLTIDDPKFFADAKPVSFGELPKLRDAVTVLGYPQGGEELSITEGVVSRVEVYAYSQSARKLLAVQIDAAINPGNSGGPVVQDNKLVGIAMQVFKSAQNIGYMIPVPVIEHFLKDLKNGTYEGFPILGIQYSNTENASLRHYFKAPEKAGGVLIDGVLPLSPAEHLLQKDDILLAIDGTPIAEDGTFMFRNKERLDLSYLISQKQVGEKIHMDIIRNGAKQTVVIPISQFMPMVANPGEIEKPSYYIYGGLVFSVLTVDLLQSWGNKWWEQVPVDFKYYLMGSGQLNKERRKQIVVLLDVLSDDINIGYQSDGNEIITEVNGQSFDSFKEFVSLLNASKKNDKYTVFGTLQNEKIILDNKGIDGKTQRIIRRNHIPAAYSEDVRAWLGGQP